MCLVLLSIITAATLIRISTVLLVEVAHRRSGYFSSNPDRNLNLEEGKTGVPGEKHLDRQQILHWNATSSIPSRFSHVTCERAREKTKRGREDKRGYSPSSSFFLACVAGRIVFVCVREFWRWSRHSCGPLHTASQLFCQNFDHANDLVWSVSVSRRLRGLFSSTSSRVSSLVSNMFTRAAILRGARSLDWNGIIAIEWWKEIERIS